MLNHFLGKKVVVTLLCIGWLSAGCISQTEQIRRGLAGQPSEYQDGFVDGCPSGYAAAGNPYERFTKNAVRYTNDRLYAQGWEDGFRTCKGKYDSLGQALR